MAIAPRLRQRACVGQAETGESTYDRPTVLLWHEAATLPQESEWHTSDDELPELLALER